VTVRIPDGSGTTGPAPAPGDGAPVQPTA